MPIGTDLTLTGIAGAAGFIGAAIYLSAYSMMQMGILRGQSYAYAALVIVGATCVAFSAIGAFNPAVLVMQLFYIAISLMGIVRLFVMSRMLRIRPEDRAFIRAHLPDLRPEHARTLLRHGRWVDFGAGEIFAREGQPLEHLIFLARGEATVMIDGKFVGTCEDCFIGELTLLTGEPATATVTTSRPSRALMFDARSLRQLLRRQPDIKLALIAGFTGATKALLLRRNREALVPPEAAE